MRKLLCLLVAGAVSLAACGSGSGAVVSTVNGHDVTVGEVEALFDSDGATISKDEFAGFLSYQIQWLIVNEAAEVDYGLTTTEDEVTAEADRIYDQVATEGDSREDFLAGNGVTEEFLRNTARQNILVLAIREMLVDDLTEPTAEEIDAQRQTSIDTQEVCASHILVETEEEATDVVTRLEGGEDFSVVAQELSTDPGTAPNGGALGCAAANTYVDSFAEAVRNAPVGEIYDDIVESEFGFHVILVTARADLPTDEDLANTVKDVAVESMLEEWFLSVVEAAEVTVDDDYGTWQANPPSVVPPSS